MTTFRNVRTDEATDLPALPARLIDMHNHAWFEGDGSEWLARMDRLSIEVMVLLGLPDETPPDWTGSAWGTNARMLEMVRRHPGRFVGGCFLDPRRGPQAVTDLRRWHAEGIRIVKLFPNYGYFPDDESLRPFFEAVAELKMAVLSHCGWAWAAPNTECASYYSSPGRFEKLIRLFPETIFILAHMGGISGFLEAIMLSTRTPNTYLDCSPGQGEWVLEAAGPMAATVPPDKLLWGADTTNLDRILASHRKLLANAGFGSNFESVFYSNGRAVLERIGAIEAVPA